MANKYLSDLHLGHERMLKMAKEGVNGQLGKRAGFRDISEINDYIIQQWNEHVNSADDIWILGDFSYRSRIDVGKYLARLSGHKHLIIGNHDIKWMKNVDLARYFENVSHMDVIKDAGKTIILCHYLLMEWSQSRHARYSLSGCSWLIHGYIHDSTTCEAYHYIKEKLPCALNAGFEIPGNDYPMTFEELLENNHKWYGREINYM